MHDQPRVLVVEDDPGIAQVLTDTLIDEAFEIRHALDGRMALAILDEWLPHVIILDLMMPVMDGWSFRAAQRNLSGAAAAVPVIILTGAREVRARAAELVPAAVITKPFDLDSLVRTVRQVCNGKSH
jgi:two-component system, chemotaxis family, chemotaxis protein CheY